MFAAFGYLALYLAGKLQCFTQEGRSQSWRLLAILTPMIASLAVAISRIQDYRHHWEDVVVGGLIGLLMALCCYLHHYPSPLSDISMYPYSINNDPLSMTNNTSSSLTLMTNRSQQSSSRLQLTEIKTM
jgi:cytochrome bd-type quinol oxidase subunit 2